VPKARHRAGEKRLAGAPRAGQVSAAPTPPEREAEDVRVSGGDADRGEHSRRGRSSGRRAPPFCKTTQLDRSGFDEPRGCCGWKGFAAGEQRRSRVAGGTWPPCGQNTIAWRACKAMRAICICWLATAPRTRRPGVKGRAPRRNRRLAVAATAGWQADQRAAKVAGRIARAIANGSRTLINPQT